MKRIVILSTVVAVLLLTAFVVVRAETRGRQGWCGHRWHRFGPASYVAHELKLTDAQRTQIQALWQAERPTFSAQLHQLLADNRQMNALAASANPDPAEEQKIADRESTTLAAMLMEKARLQSKIESSILNPEQRAKAEELREKWEFHLDRFADRLATQPEEK